MLPAQLAAAVLCPLLMQLAGLAAGQGLDVTLGQLGAGALATAAQFDLFQGERTFVPYMSKQCRQPTFHPVMPGIQTY